jgi:hypothetical protein
MSTRYRLFVCAPVLLLIGTAGAQQYPVLDMIADNVVQKYERASCEQLWQQKGKPKTAKEKEAIQLLKGDAQMRAEFLNRIAAPVANKMFQCGMLP